MDDIMGEKILAICPGYVIEKRGGFLGFGKKGWYCKFYFTTERFIVSAEDKGDNVAGYLFAAKPYYMANIVSTRERLKMEENPVNSIIKSELIRFDVPYSDLRVLEFDDIVGELEVFGSDLNKPVCRIDLKGGRYDSTKYIGPLRDLCHKILPEKTD